MSKNVRLVIGGLTACMMASTYINYINYVNMSNMKSELSSIKTELDSSTKATKNDSDKLKDLGNRVEKFERTIEEVDKRVREKLLLRSKVSNAILKTSDCKRDEATKLSNAICEVVDEFNLKYGYPRDIATLLAIISVESDFKNLEPNDAYAIGYAQVTPPCLEEVNKLAGWSYTMDDMYDAKSNLRVAWYILNRDIKMLKSRDKALVAYNQGYRHLSRAVEYCRTDKTSYMYKVNARRRKYLGML